MKLRRQSDGKWSVLSVNERKSLSSTVSCLSVNINVLEGCILLNFTLAFRELYNVFWHHNSKVCIGAKSSCSIEISA